MQLSAIFLAAVGLATAQTTTRVPDSPAAFALSLYNGTDCSGTFYTFFRGTCLDKPIVAGGSVNAYSGKTFTGYSGAGCTGEPVVSLDSTALGHCTPIDVEVASWAPVAA